MTNDKYVDSIRHAGNGICHLSLVIYHLSFKKRNPELLLGPAALQDILES